MIAYKKGDYVKVAEKDRMWNRVKGLPIGVVTSDSPCENDCVRRLGTKYPTQYGKNWFKPISKEEVEKLAKQMNVELGAEPLEMKEYAIVEFNEACRYPQVTMILDNGFVVGEEVEVIVRRKGVV